MDTQAVKDWLEIAGLAGGAGATIWAAWKYAWPVLACSWVRVLNVWHALERLQALLNGPESMPVRIEQLHTQASAASVERAAQSEVIGVVAKKVDAIANTQRAVMNTNARMATFEADDQGLWTITNRAYLKWTGLQAKEAQRWGWLNAVHPDDIVKVRSAWESCVKDCRRFEFRCRMVNVVTGKIFEVDMSADPIPEGVVPCERWFGAMYEVQSVAVAA
jgi:PAS domain S-box-containing protein